MKRIVIGICAALAACSAAYGERPEYFTLMADDYPLPQQQLPAPRPQRSAWQPSAEERGAGFAAGLTDMELIPAADYLWAESEPRRAFRMVALRGEFRAQPFAVRALRPLAGFAIEPGALRSDSGAVIGAEHLDVRQVMYRSLRNTRGEVREGNMLIRAKKELPGDVTAWFWLTVHAPEDAAPGVYRGELTLRAAGGAERKMPLALRVAGREFRYPEGNWGFWIPGHFRMQSKGYCRNYAPAWWDSDRALDYFRLWKTRGFNTPTYSGIYPDVWRDNGVLKTDFSEINRMVAAQRKAGLDGAAVCDVFVFEYWAHAATQWINKRYGGVIPQSGTLGIFRQDGKNSSETKVPYGAMDAGFFVELLKQFDANAKKNNWPHYYIYPEEEVDNRDYKTAGYEFFMPHVKATLGDKHCVVIDNSVGFPWGGLDRGKRDKITVRSYNSWDKAALEAARRDGAVNWTFNQGFNRTSWGVRLLQLNASGFHQWADLWDGGNYGIWFNAIPDGKGKVLTSVNFERSSMGLRDLAAFREWERLIDALRRAGKHEPAERMARELASLHGDIPLYLFDFRAMMHTVKDSELEAARYLALLRSDEARRILGEETSDVVAASSAATPAPALIAVEPRTPANAPTEKKRGPELQAAQVAQVELDGRGGDAGYGSPGARSGAFVWTKVLENRHRALASSAEDFEQRYKPQPVSMAMTYTDEGLYVAFRADRPAMGELKAERGNDDPLLWKDDCIELFLEPVRGDGLRHLIVNGKGHVTLLKNSAELVRDHGIRVRTVPLTQTGYEQELFLPWRALGLARMPSVGECWRMNAGRGYHSKEQYVTWSQVRESFGLADGTLRFGGSDIRLKHLEIGTPYPGRNRIGGALEPGAYQVTLTAPDGTIFAGAVTADGALTLDYTVPGSADAGVWTLRIADAAGRELHKSSFRRGDGGALELDGALPRVISGDRAHADLTLRLGNAEHDIPLHAELIDAAGRRYPVKSIRLPKPQASRVYLDTTGMPGGTYTVRLWVMDQKNAVEFPLQLLPSPF